VRGKTEAGPFGLNRTDEFARQRVRELELEADLLAAQLVEIRAERDKWKDMARDWQKRARKAEADD